MLWLLVGDDAVAQTPAAPTIDHVVAGDTALTVAWSPPAVTTGVVAYDVRHILTSATDKSDANWTVVDDAWTEGSLHVILTGLTNGASYDVQVRAATASVDGDWSTTTTGTPAEPGAMISEAAGIVAGLPVRGVLGSSGDVDYFGFEITGTNTREYYAYTTGDTDTRGVLYNASGAQLNQSDDAYVATGPRNFLLAGRLAPGTYYLSVTGGRTGEQGAYTLLLGTPAETTGRSDATPIRLGEVASGVFGAASDTDYYQLVLPYETEVAVRGSGMVPNTVSEILNWAGTKVAVFHAHLWPYNDEYAIRARLGAGTYYISIRPGGGGTGFYNLHVDRSPDPGTTRATAARLGLGATGGGLIAPAGDVDWFRIDLESATQVWISFASDARATPATRTFFIDVDVKLTDHDGKVLPTRFTYESRFGIVHARYFGGRLEAGTYYLRVAARHGTATGFYLTGLRQNPSFHRLPLECPKPPADAPSDVDDPLFGCQWHLVNGGGGGGTAGEDINLGSAWNTTMGAGVNVVVVDRGLEWNHEDLVDNALPSLNHSYRGGTDVAVDSSHGTSVGGIIAARDNGVGLRGVAPRASIYAYDMLWAFSTVNIADAMARNRAVTSVSNHSWGASVGANVARTSRLVNLAMEAGLREGDGGKGVVYVLSAGNDHQSGGWASLEEFKTHHGATVACAVDNSGIRTPYSEMGPNLWVCGPSRRDGRPGIATTYLRHGYGDGFSGTSAAAPMVSGVVALVRAANRALTWRDVKLILAETARKNDPSNPGWLQAGRRRAPTATKQRYDFNHQYGFRGGGRGGGGAAGRFVVEPSFLSHRQGGLVCRCCVGSRRRVGGLPERGGRHADRLRGVGGGGRFVRGAVIPQSGGGAGVAVGCGVGAVAARRVGGWADGAVSVRVGPASGRGPGRNVDAAGAGPAVRRDGVEAGWVVVDGVRAPCGTGQACDGRGDGG